MPLVLTMTVRSWKKPRVTYGLTPVSEVGSGKPHAPEKQRLTEIIDRLNEIFGASATDELSLYPSARKLFSSGCLLRER